MSEPSLDCVFCKIKSGQLPANNQEYEDEDCFVVHDIHPQAPVHLEVIAKVHGIEFATADEQLLTRLFAVVRKMISDKGLSSSYRVSVNGGGATLVRNHLHIHVLGKVDSKRNV